LAIGKLDALSPADRTPEDRAVLGVIGGLFDEPFGVADTSGGDQDRRARRDPPRPTLIAAKWAFRNSALSYYDDPAVLRRELAKTLAGYKMAKEIDIRSDLRREDSGKICKRRLRDPWGIAGRVILDQTDLFTRQERQNK
jgi:acyl-CoA synthetase (AMP-forming)/AMP-acid ligase II